MKNIILSLILLAGTTAMADEGSGRSPQSLVNGPVFATDMSLQRQVTPISTPDDNFQVEGLIPPTDEVELDALTPTTGESTPLAGLVEGVD